MECLRRGIDLAQLENRDVGYIGLANVLHRHGYLEDALITARAALDIRHISVRARYTVIHLHDNIECIIILLVTLCMYSSGLHLEIHTGGGQSPKRFKRGQIYCVLYCKFERARLDQASPAPK